MPTLEYAEPPAQNPLLALRRILWVGLAWSTLTLLTSGTTFLSWLVMPQGGLDVYLAIPYWWADIARPMAAIMILIACFVWRRIGVNQRSMTTAILAGAAVMLAFAPLAVLWNNRGITFDVTAPPPARILMGQAMSCLEIAAVPIALLWAAASPSRFTPSRLAGLAAVVLALAAANDSQSIFSLHESLHFRTRAFWEALLTRSWLVGVVMNVAIEAVAALAFASAAFRLRWGSGRQLATAGSWLLIALAIILQVTVYGLWWEAWQMSVLQHMLRHLDNFAFVLLSFCLGLAFLTPIRYSETGPHYRAAHPHPRSV